MDFFGEQDRAKRATTALFVALAVTIVGLAAITFTSASLIALMIGGGSGPGREGAVAWSPVLAALSIGGVLIVVLVGYALRISELRSGQNVALALGGRLVQGESRDPAEQRLVNIVEEMAIAAGTPAPPVYVLDEKGVNAFAAGWSPDDAVIGVTRAALDKLNREQLQGVIAHEFSHILHTDVRINMRLVALVAGYAALSVIGGYMLTVAFYSGGGRRDGRLVIAMAVLGILLWLIGSLGALAATIIKAAVSRQREFLADASAVQYTRNPDGISGALRVIGGTKRHGRIRHRRAAEFSHMYVAGAAGLSNGSLLASHPPITERIKRILPDWDGQMIDHGPDESEQLPPPKRSKGLADLPPEARAQAVLEAAVIATEAQAVALPSPAAQREPDGSSALDEAHAIHERIPEELLNAAHSPLGARALVHAMLLADDPAERATQLARLRQNCDRPIYDELGRVEKLLRGLDPDLRLPLLDIATMSLRSLSPQQALAFIINIDQLVLADDHVDLMEWSLRRIVTRVLNVPAERTSKGVPNAGAAALIQQAAVIGSAVAHFIAENDTSAARRAFDKAAESMPRMRAPLEFIPAEAIDGAALDRAVATLEALGSRQRIAISIFIDTVCRNLGADPDRNQLVRGLRQALRLPQVGGPRTA